MKRIAYMSNGRKWLTQGEFRSACCIQSKIFEQIVPEWLRKHFQGKRVDQYGFRTGCSMIDAAGKLKKLTALAIQKRQFGAAVSLDIQNAFNLMPWMFILEVLMNTKVPVYLHNIIQDYFRDWVVFAQTASGMVRKEITCRVPQGSVLGSLIWNIGYDDNLKEEVPPWVSMIICYTDDTLAVTAENDIPMLERKVNTILQVATHWIVSVTTKMEAVVFTRNRRFIPPSFCLKGSR